MAAASVSTVALMRRRRAALLNAAAPAIDLVVQPLAWLAAWQMRLLRKLTPPRAPRSFRVLDRVGVYPLIDHYYDPLINLRRLQRPLDAPRAIAGLDLALAQSRDFVAGLQGLDMPGQASPPTTAEPGYDPSNTMFCPLDAGVLYGIVQHYRPRRIIEVGCGMSTLVFRMAIEALTTLDPGYRCEHCCIEPFEAPWLERLPVRVLRLQAEHAPLDLIRSLEAGDILFIDSSHVIRPQGDVVIETLEWLGNLAPGVIVHIHDIYTPHDYPDSLLRTHRFIWTEQYMVEAFLCFNNAFEVLAPVHALWRDATEWAHAICPSQAQAGRTVPSSLWLRRAG